MPNTPEIQPVVIYIQERSETQLHTAGFAALQNKNVGFLSVSGQCGVYGENFIFYEFYGFGGIRSTQPTMLRGNLRNNNRLGSQVR